jgi:hypothetical protein
LTRKIGARKVGALATRLALVKLFMRVQDVAELFAFVSNGSRLSTFLRVAPPKFFDVLFYRNRQTAQTPGTAAKATPAFPLQEL